MELQTESCSAFRLRQVALFVKIACLFTTVLASSTVLAAVIDDFEQTEFAITTPSNPSVHHAGGSASIIGGDRDVWTLACDGPGSQTSLTVSTGDDGVVVDSNDGSIYRVWFQYDGTGINSRSLNYNLLTESHNAILVNIAGVEISPSDVIEIRMLLFTNWGDADSASAQLTLPVNEPGQLSFPFNEFEQFGELDFSDLDEVSFTVTLGASMGLTISDVRTGLIIPEPATGTVLALFIVMFLSYSRLHMTQRVR